MGSGATDKDAQKVIDKASYHKLIRDKLLGTPWNMLGDSIKTLQELKKHLVKEDD